MNSLICECCRQHRDIYDLVLCTYERPVNESRPYYCKHYCSEDECGHALNCEQQLHKTCWETHIPPFQLKRGGGEHRQISALDEAFIQIIMHSEANDDKQRQLHRQDRKAEWFRVNLANPAIKDSQPLLQISDRFRGVCDPGSDGNTWAQDQYPSFVSFVGDTGVGKSTLVNAMITIGRIEGLKHARGRHLGPLPRSDLDSVFNARSHGPVTRSANLDRASVPTSTGVHLYRDPTITKVEYSESTTVTEDVPILFADCEGFRGGTTKTSAERSGEATGHSVEQRHSLRPRVNSNLPAPLQRGGMDLEFCIDEVDIKAPDFKKAGKESAELFYAHFLYAFSDVIVFVTNEDQKLHNDMQRLLEWAASAVEKSVGRKSQKTLIVVRNGPRLLHDKEFYDGDKLKKTLFGSFGNIWEHSQILTDLKRRHDNVELMENEIHDNDDFFRIFFQATKMCYIPLSDKAPPDEIYLQYQKLRTLIVDGTKAGQRVRSTSWTLYDVPTMSHLLTRAFYHFAMSSDPFNFYNAARKDNPTPISVPGHIANLLRHMRTSPSKLVSFQEIVAVCLISFVYREFTQGIPLWRMAHRLYANRIDSH